MEDLENPWGNERKPPPSLDRPGANWKKVGIDLYRDDAEWPEHATERQPRWIVPGGARIRQFNPAFLAQDIWNATQVTRDTVVWVGFITGTGDTANTSSEIDNYSFAGGVPAVGDVITGAGIPAATTITFVDTVLNKIFISNPATITATGVALTLTGNAHPYPPSVQGYWQFHTNLMLSFAPSVAVGPFGNIMSKVQLLDQASAVLSEASVIFTYPSATKHLQFVSFASDDIQVGQFYGVKFHFETGDGIHAAFGYTTTALACSTDESIFTV